MVFQNALCPHPATNFTGFVVVAAAVYVEIARGWNLLCRETKLKPFAQVANASKRSGLTD